MKPLSIRWRLTLWYAGALAIVLTCFCLLLLFLMRQQLFARLDAALREELRELVLEVQLAKNSNEFQQHVHTRFFQHDVYDFLITNPQDQVLFASSGISHAQSSALSASRPADELQFFSSELVGPARVASQQINVPAGTFFVYAVTPLSPLRADLLTLQLLMAILLPLGLALALVGGYFLAARALAPVSQIVRVAETITISNLHQRIDIPNSNDELGQLASTLNSLIARLQSAVDEIQRFTADASHELRTPLAVLRAEAESALQQQRSPDEYQQTLSTVVEEATRLGRLADQLLNLSRHDAGLTDCCRDPVRLDAVIRDVVNHVRQLAIDHQISFDITTVAPCELLGDELLLGQALFNVMENAIKYTADGGQVTVECEADNNSIVLRIRDTGIGIPHEHLARVFDRFYRVDASRQSTTGGAGLGLAITRTAIQMHGGTIEIDSEQGVGTTLTIRLPGTAVDADSHLSIPKNTLVPTGA